MATAQDANPLPDTQRIASIDVFRGLTMLVMLFVNDIGDVDLGHIAHAPWWLKHTPSKVDGLTLPDVVFPTFLFIVGLSIPLSLGRRIDTGQSLVTISWHIVSRAAAMIFIGLCMVNACHGVSLDEAAMGMSGALWRVSLFSGIVLFWNHYPPAHGLKRWLIIVLRVLAAETLIYLVVILRADQHGETIWLRPRWWGIIGLIGWAYLVSAFIWLTCRDYGAGLMGAFSLLLVLNIADRSGILGDWSRSVSAYLPDIRTLSSLAAMVVAGAVVATVFRTNSPAATPTGRIAWMLVFAAGFAVAGFLLRPLWGIHKNTFSPSWSLYCLAIASAVYVCLYWLIDVRKTTCGMAWIGQAGSNTLLMYFLPHVLYSLLALFGIDYLQTHFQEGWPGVARSAALAFGFLGVTWVLTRCGVRLRL